VHERPEDVTALQELLDRSYLAAGEHLRSIHTAPRRLTGLPELVGIFGGFRGSATTFTLVVALRSICRCQNM